MLRSEKNKQMKQFLLLLFFCFGLTIQSFAQQSPAPKGDLSTLPESNGYINDFADILSEEEEEILEKYLDTYENSSSRQIAVVSLNSLYNYGNVRDLTTDLSNKWGIGQKDLNNGVLILIAPKDGKMRIGTGYGTEKILSNQICGKVLNQYMLPFFREGHFYEGILSGLILLVDHWGAPTEAELEFLDTIED